MIPALPWAEGVNVEWQEAVEAASAVRVQLVESKEPEKDVENVAVPAGAVELVVLVSVTVAVQIEGWFTTTGVEQVTVVEVVRRLTMTLKPVVVELPL